MSTLGSSIALFRRRREAMFSATCTVVRPAGTGEFDPDTGAVVDDPATAVYSGACDVREMAWQGTDVQVAEREQRFRRAEVWLPHDTDVRKDDVVTVTASTHDAQLVGQAFRVTDVFLDAWQVVRRAIAEKVT